METIKVGVFGVGLRGYNLLKHVLDVDAKHHAQARPAGDHNHRRPGSLRQRGSLQYAIIQSNRILESIY